jgi:hypothetical protein
MDTAKYRVAYMISMTPIAMKMLNTQLGNGYFSNKLQSGKENGVYERLMYITFKHKEKQLCGAKQEKDKFSPH